MKNGKCPAGEYYCYTNKECKPIPKGFMVGRAGMLRKENGHSVEDTKKNGNGNGNGNGGNGNGNGGNGNGGTVSEEGLRDWFGKSKSKDGKKGWVNVVTGDSCASDKPGEGIPKCVSSAKRASMSKKERRAAAAAKRRKDPGQQQKTGAAKPTNVKTDRKTRKENVELVDAYGNTFATIHDVIKPEPMKETACPRCGHNPCICRETYDIEAMTESNEWNKMSSQEKAEYMAQRMVNQARGAAARYDAAKKAAQNVTTTTGSVTVREAKDKKGKGSGSKDACYHKVKSRYSVWPSAYASGALVKCRKVGAANWGNKTKKEEFEFSPSQVMALESAGLIQLNEKGQKCWKGYEKKGTKKMFGKTYNNCVKKEEVTYEERIRINQNGHTYAVMLNWRGKTYSIQIFFPELRKPTRQEVEDKIRKIYPDAKVTYFAPKEFDPADPTVMVGEQNGEVVSERSRLDGPEERKKDLDKRYDPKGGGTNPFQYVPVKKAQKEHVGESRKIKKKFGPKPKPGNPAEYLKNLPAPPTKNLPLPEQLTSENKTGIPNNPNILQRIDAMLPGNAFTYQGFKDKTRKPYQYKSPETGPNYTGNKVDVDNYRAGGGNAAMASGQTADQVRAQGAKNLKARPKQPNVHNWTDNNVKTYAGSPPMRFKVGESKSDGDPCWDSHKQVGMKKKGGKMVPNCVPKEEVEVQSEGAAWTKKSGKNQSGGLNEKGRKSYERENPGSDLKRPSKKVGNPRRKSFCARMRGMKKKLTSAKTARDPDSRINKSLRAWNC